MTEDDNSIERARLWTRHHARRFFVLKGLVTLSFAAALIDGAYALPIAIAGNMLWLWVDVD